ncbi:MAG: hypothetical protein ACRDLL_17045, partial [Solirubrobacterales bacterium]
MALATRALDLSASGAPYVGMDRKKRTGTVDPAAVLKIAQRIIGQGVARAGKAAADIGPGDARSLLEAWLRSVEIDLRGRDLLAFPQAEEFSHADLYRRARRTHERRRVPVACRWSRWPKGDRPRWSRIAIPGCSAGPTRTTSPVPSCSWRRRLCCAAISAPRPPAVPASAPGSGRSSSLRKATDACSPVAARAPGKRPPALPEGPR